MSSASVNEMAGAGGGIIAHIITYPLQTVNRAVGEEEEARERHHNTSTLFQLLQLIQMEGWGGLYSGLKPSLIATATSQVKSHFFVKSFYT
ncbi:hypothetical protein PVAP13_2KG335500 [Panicum virgatum]|uniref:Uncharacterized protein n=1 Tax=Panicum virgatum TaxID=38727 RepID=A0A8T0W531_PANVG|nr:hypothetical protein PVAP13_2KG335500 [Panicum virgatum]